MALTKLTKDMDIIQKLDDEPNDVGGLTADELKAKFDEGNNATKTWVNDTFIPEVEKALSEAKEFKNTAQEIDDAVDKVQAGTFVKKTGDTMTGHLESVNSAVHYFTSKASGGSAFGNFFKNNDGTVAGAVGAMAGSGVISRLFMGFGTDPSQLVNSLSVTADSLLWHNQPVLHSGNKPSGSYTGNGSATARTIDTGGIGDFCIVWGGDKTHFQFVTPAGALNCVISTGVMKVIPETTFSNGILRMQTTDGGVNLIGIVYNYQVL